MKYNKRYVTITCDAGFKDGLVTYGIWISCEKGRFKSWGVAKQKYVDSTQGEMIAICKGMYQVHEKKLHHNCDVLVINTDSLNAIRHFESERVPDQYKIFHDCFHNIRTQMQQTCKFEISLRHVKGHSNKNDKRSYVNRWADGMARKARNDHNKKKP